MPEPLRPDSAKVFGRSNWIWIPTIASAALAPTVAEATAASGLDVTRMLFAGDEPEVNATVNRARLDRRAGDTETFEFIGPTDYEGGEMILAIQPQAAAGSDGKKAWEKFQAGTLGYIGKRQDLGRATNIAAGQFLTYVMPVEIGQPIPLPAKGQDATAQAAFRATFAMRDPGPKFMVAVLA